MLERTVFSTPRAAEFFEQRGLQTATEMPWRRWGDVVCKELADNALDSSERDGIPEVEIAFEVIGDLQYVTVSDNGPGIPAEDVARILDYSVLVSSKSAYRSPSRGLQGNAMKTIFGIVHVLGADEPVVIHSQGYRHQIAGSLDPARNVVIDYPDPTLSAWTTGTSISVPLPVTVQTTNGEEPFVVDAAGWAAKFAAFNPHAAISYLGNEDGGEGAVFYKPQVSDGWSKPVEADRLVPAWYDVRAFERLIFSHIAAARNGSRDLPLGEFVLQFDGLKGTQRAANIRATLPGITHLSMLGERPDAIRLLLATMQDLSRAPKPEKLGHVPEDHYREWIDRQFGVEEWWFRRKRYTDRAGLPWVLEVGAAVTERPGSADFGVNYSPPFGDPLGKTWLSAADTCATGAASFLGHSDAIPGASNDHRRAVVAHVITPAAEFTGKGKIALEIPPDVAGEFAAVIAAATRQLREDAKRRERDARRADRHAQERRRRSEPRKIGQKEAIFAVMEQAIEQQRGDTDLPFSSHSLFYKIRPLAQQYAGRVLDLKAKHVEQTLIPEWQRIHGPIRGLYYDPRGELHEPHGGRIIRLGTREVAVYKPPEWTFNKILVVEKKGLWPVLEAGRLAEQHDMAIVTSEGFGSTGCRALLASMPPGEVVIFSLHDADHSGYNLSLILGEETKRMPGHSVVIRDIGLTVGDAIAIGLDSEEYTRLKALPARLVPRLNEEEMEWFGGTAIAWKGGKPSQWKCRRTELNAFASPALIAYIEDALAAAGVPEKIVPPRRVIRHQLREQFESAVKTQVEAIIADLADTDAIVRDLQRQARRHAGRDISRGAVRERLSPKRETPWWDIARAEAGRQVSAASVPLDQLVARMLRDRLDAVLRDGDQ